MVDKFILNLKERGFISLFACICIMFITLTLYLNYESHIFLNKYILLEKEDFTFYKKSDSFFKLYLKNILSFSTMDFRDQYFKYINSNNISSNKFSLENEKIFFSQGNYEYYISFDFFESNPCFYVCSKNIRGASIYRMFMRAVNKNTSEIKNMHQYFILPFTMNSICEKDIKFFSSLVLSPLYMS